MRTSLAAFVLALLAACSGGTPPPETPVADRGLTATSLFCAYGGVGIVPDPLPPGYETQFASMVIAIDNPGPPIPAVSVAGLTLVDAAGTALASLQRVDHVVVLDAVEPEGPTMGRFAVYLNAEGRPFDGTLPTGHTIVRARVSLDHGPGAFPAHCRLSLAGTSLTIEGGLDGSWPTS